MIHAIVGAAMVMAAAQAAPPLVFPTGAPRLPPVVDVQAAEGFTACRYWRAPNGRPVPSPEAVALAGAGGVQRDGPRLTIGRQTFTDARGEDEIDRVRHQYVGRVAGVGAHLVYRRPYEGHAWLLVTDDADPIALPGMPVASPRGHALAAAAEDPTFRQSGVTIVEHRMAGMAIGAEIGGAAWPCDLHWVSDTELRLKVSVDGPGQAPRRWTPAVIRREAGRWVYHPPVP